MTQLDTLDNEQFQQFLAAAEDDAAALDPQTTSMEIIGRVLQAKTADDVLASDAAIASEDYVGRPFTLLSVRFSKSQFEGDGPQFFGIMHGANVDGEPIVLTSSAGRIIAQAFKLRDLDALPVQVVIRKAERASAAGYFPMWLEKPEASF